MPSLGLTRPSLPITEFSQTAVTLVHTTLTMAMGSSPETETGPPIPVRASNTGTDWYQKADKNSMAD